MRKKRRGWRGERRRERESKIEGKGPTLRLRRNLVRELFAETPSGLIRLRVSVTLSFSLLLLSPLRNRRQLEESDLPLYLPSTRVARKFAFFAAFSFSSAQLFVPLKHKATTTRTRASESRFFAKLCSASPPPADLITIARSQLCAMPF